MQNAKYVTQHSIRMCWIFVNEQLMVLTVIMINELQLELFLIRTQMILTIIYMNFMHRRMHEMNNWLLSKHCALLFSYHQQEPHVWHRRLHTVKSSSTTSTVVNMYWHFCNLNTVLWTRSFYFIAFGRNLRLKLTFRIIRRIVQDRAVIVRTQTT